MWIPSPPSDFPAALSFMSLHPHSKLPAGSPILRGAFLTSGNQAAHEHLLDCLLHTFLVIDTCVNLHSVAHSRWLLKATVILFFFKEFIYLFLDIGEGREKERERNINVWLPLIHPQKGTWPSTQARALTENQTRDLWFTGQCSIHWATPARAKPQSF